MKLFYACQQGSHGRSSVSRFLKSIIYRVCFLIIIYSDSVCLVTELCQGRVTSEIKNSWQLGSVVCWELTAAPLTMTLGLLKRCVLEILTVVTAQHACFAMHVALLNGFRFFRTHPLTAIFISKKWILHSCFVASADCLSFPLALLLSLSDSC